MENVQDIIGRNLKYIRYQSKKSQEKFYGNLGLNSKYLASVERGEINVTVEFLSKLAKILNIDIRDFFDPDEKHIIEKKRIDEK